MDETEVPFDFGHAAERIERRGRDDRRRAELTGLAGVFDHAVRFGVDAADEHRHATVDDVDRRANDLLAAGIGAERDLARRAEREYAVDPGVDHAVDRAGEAWQVELLVCGERGDRRRNDAVELLCHDY